MYPFRQNETIQTELSSVVAQISIVNSHSKNLSVLKVSTRRDGAVSTLLHSPSFVVIFSDKDSYFMKWLLSFSAFQFGLTAIRTGAHFCVFIRAQFKDYSIPAGVRWYADYVYVMFMCSLRDLQWKPNSASETYNISITGSNIELRLHRLEDVSYPRGPIWKRTL